MPSPFDLIIAPITAVGGAVGVLRISGKGAWNLAGQLFTPWPENPKPRHSYYGKFSNGDDGLLVLFENERSYTGEECVEMSIHGSLASVTSLLELGYQAGARMADPGEFSLRAFLNGRIDLAQAEGVRDTVNAVTLKQLQMATRHRTGHLSTALSAIRDQVRLVLTTIEAQVDFSEELGPLDREGLSADLQRAISELAQLERTGVAGRMIRNGFRVAIVGPPNAGKSSLLNAILGTERAIVTPIAGTTRDTLEESIDYKGIRITFIDTAGLRETTDPIEQMGIRRTHETISNADAVWHVFDATQSPPSPPLDKTVILVANKSDLATPQTGTSVSAKTGTGIAELLEKTIPPELTLSAELLVNERHAILIGLAQISLKEALSILQQDLPPDLLSVHLNNAMDELGQITGETVREDTLTNIFKTFCVGK